MQLAGPQAPLMMTLSAFAAIDETRLPGEPVPAQEKAILADLGKALRAMPGSWSPVWVGVSEASANMVYLAQNAGTNEYVVVIRGTEFANPVDWLEDFQVKNTRPFTVGKTVVQVAEGADLGFRLVTSAAGGSQRTTLLRELATRVPGGQGATIFITGHSLGGALATMVALYLQQNLPAAKFQVCTFAAPTAGLTDFAELFDSTFPGSSAGSSSRVHNIWDVVPHAWEADTLQKILGFYPPPGPAQDQQTKQRIANLVKLPGANPYQQPEVDVVQLNGDGSDESWKTALKDPNAAFMPEVGFQHDCNTYLQLMDAPTVAMLAGLKPSSAARNAKSVSVKVSGLGFTRNSSVSFANPGITVENTVWDSQSQLSIQVSVASSAPLGPCDVTVTAGSGTAIPGGTSRFLVL